MHLAMKELTFLEKQQIDSLRKTTSIKEMGRIIGRRAELVSQYLGDDKEWLGIGRKPKCVLVQEQVDIMVNMNFRPL